MAEGGGLRRGKWTVEEERYVERVIRDFNSGLLHAAPGTTLRNYLSEKLNCDPMRITKKFTGDASIGKRVYHPRENAPEPALERARREVDAPRPLFRCARRAHVRFSPLRSRSSRRRGGANWSRRRATRRPRTGGGAATATTATATASATSARRRRSASTPGSAARAARSRTPRRSTPSTRPPGRFTVTSTCAVTLGRGKKESASTRRETTARPESGRHERDEGAARRGRPSSHPRAHQAIVKDGEALRASVVDAASAASFSRRARRARSTCTSSDEEATSLLVDFLRSAQRQRTVSFAEGPAPGDAAAAPADGDEARAAKRRRPADDDSDDDGPRAS